MTFNTTEEASTDEAPTDELTEEASTEEAPKRFMNRIPANWSIKPANKDGFITAINSITGETFEGSVANFNKSLRG